MKKRNRTLTLLTCMLGGVLILAPTSFAQDSVFSAANVFKLADPMTPVAGGSTLLRNTDQVWMTFSSAEFAPNSVYTVWWIVFNNPDACGDDGCNDGDFDNAEVMASALHATGLMVGPDGVGNASAHLEVGNTPGQVLFGPGLINIDAEIHIASHNHGPALDGEVDVQLSTFGGGCTMETGGPGPGGNPCETDQFAVHLAPAGGDGGNNEDCNGDGVVNGIDLIGAGCS